MSNRNKAAGSQFVASLVPELKKLWPFVEARAQHGSRDRGDLINTRPLTIECKREKGFGLAGWWKEAQVEAQNDNGIPIVIHKRKGTAKPEDQWVLMDVATLMKLMQDGL